MTTISKCGAAILVITMLVRAQLYADQITCEQTAAMARMARARTSSELKAARDKAGKSYLAQLVSAYKGFRLSPNSRSAAEQLLLLIPKDDEQLGMVFSLGSVLCDREPITDMETLGPVGDDMANQLSKAVLIAPQYMATYVAHSLNEVQVPDSDYAVRMKTVCQRRHATFLAAVKKLTAKEQLWFSEHVMDPSTCRVIALPEAQDRP